MAEKISNEALKIWMALPTDIRRKILSDVWCVECRTAVTICDYSADFEGGVVVLHGFCGACGHKVARVLEGCGDSKGAYKRANVRKPERQISKESERKCALEYYIFDVSVEACGAYDIDKKALRKIQIAGTKSLYNFAKVITKAFNFYFDHCFGFYDNFQRYPDSKKAYELFVDVGEAPVTTTTKGVKKTKIQQVFEKPSDKMLFVFDYGDEWRFVVELKEIKNAEKWDLKPVILESVGEAPLQYPPCEDELENEK